MQPVEILNNLFFIERGYLNANHFVYRSPNPVLIDTAYIGDIVETEQRINALGVDFADIRLIISTHSHCDHIGANKYIQNKSDCDIAIHKIGKHFIDTQDDWATWWKYYNQDAEFFKATHALNDGDIIEVGPHRFRIIYTPGHASDGIALFNEDAKILISSDSLWENDMPAMTLRIEGSTALFRAQDSLEKIQTLGARIVYPGHGRPFTNVSDAIAKSQKKIQAYLKNREDIGLDLIKRISIYTLLMYKGFNQDLFFDHLTQAKWYKETVDLYFNSDYQGMYNRIMGDFISRGIVKSKNRNLVTTIKP